MEIPNINSAQLRAQEITQKEEERFSNIAKQIIEILIKEKITTKELPRVISAITELVNQKIDNVEIEKILKL